VAFVVFLICHSSLILVTCVELSVSCNLLDTRYISLYDISYHRKEFYSTAYYRAAQPYQLYIRPMIRILNILYYHGGTAVAQWLRYCATNRKVAVSIPAGVSRFFIDIKSFRSHYGPGVDTASNRNEYQEYFLGVKAAGA